MERVGAVCTLRLQATVSLVTLDFVLDPALQADLL